MIFLAREIFRGLLPSTVVPGRKGKPKCVHLSPPSKLVILFVLLLGMIVSQVAAADPAPTNDPSILTSVGQIQRLTREEAERGPAVQFDGIVTVCLTSNVAFVQGATGGVLVHFTQMDVPPEPGLSIRVNGQVHSGQYAPIVFRSRLTQLLQKLPPPPTPVLSFDEMLENRNHARWIETAGVVRCVPPAQTPGTYLEVVAGQSRILVIFTNERGRIIPPEFFGATVRLRGVCAALFNEKHQIRGAKIYVSTFADVTVVEPAVPPDQLRTVHISSLDGFTPEDLYVGHTRVRGVVLHSEPSPDPLLYVADATDAIVVQLQFGQSFPPVGSRVEVVGFPEAGGVRTLLNDGTVRVLETGPSPAPLRVSTEEFLSNKHDARLVAVRGRLVNLIHGADDWTLFWQAGQQVFSAHLAATNLPSALANLAPGTTLDLTGIVQLVQDERLQTQSPRLLLRSADDIRILASPSWWNSSRIRTATVLLLIVILAVTVWVGSLRVQVNRQLSTLKEQLQRETALEQQYRDLYDNARDLIYVEDTDGRILSANPALERITGYPQAELLQTSTAQWLLPESAERYRSWINEHRRGRPAAGFEIESRARDGRRIVLDVHARAAAGNGSAGQVLCIAREITERKAAEDSLRRAKEQLEAANQNLLARNEDLHQTNLSLQEEITERQRAETRVGLARQQLWESSREAGKAEMATNVLHNVGNVLNSVGVSAALMEQVVGKSNSAILVKVADMVKEHQADLGAFLTRHEKGRQLPNYLARLSEGLAEEHATLRREAETLTQNLATVRNIIALQQNYARMSEAMETIPLQDVVEDVLSIHASSGTWNHIEIVRDYADPTPATINRQQVLHILFNLLQNARFACDETKTAHKRITFRVAQAGPERVLVEVTDNGIGIPPESMPRLFTHGFTTRQDGHGFGLLNAAQAASHMGGTLTASSDGPGKGATFTLELPLRPPTQNP